MDIKFSIKSHKVFNVLCAMCFNLCARYSFIVQTENDVVHHCKGHYLPVEEAFVTCISRAAVTYLVPGTMNNERS